MCVFFFNLIEDAVMRYSEYKEQIKSGDLLAWSTKGVHSFMDIVTNIIRVVTQSEYEHVGVAWVISGRIFVIEAVFPNVRIRPLTQRSPFYIVPMNIEWDQSKEEFLLSKVGASYSIWKAITSVFVKLPVNQEWQCAQLANEFYKSCNINLGDSSTPADIVEQALGNSLTGLKLILGDK